ncbi:DUF4294 domain-containing protein [Barnesiella propionica]|uniref:DUF4294 domain-containing protein n=1 Tax=Barnesiella propionica TaxID=2981781 RepID=UPI0011CC5924
MKRIIFIFSIILLILSSAYRAYGQLYEHPAYERMYKAVIETGDTVWVIDIRTLHIYPPLKFKSKKEEKFYWKTVRDVKKTLPYAKIVYKTLIETYEYIETLPTEKEKQAHLKLMEKEIYKQYMPVLKKFTLSQGKMLIKLINRECNQSSYGLIKAFLGSFRAGFWQTFGRLFGVTLKTDWDPEGKDAMIERICVLVEEGVL